LSKLAQLPLGVVAVERGQREQKAVLCGMILHNVPSTYHPHRAERFISSDCSARALLACLTPQPYGDVENEPVTNELGLRVISASRFSARMATSFLRKSSCCL
jgi:hypothetical protein